MHAMKPSVQTATAYLRVSVVSLFLAFAAGCQVPAPAQVVATEHPSTHVNISETSAHSADISESRPESTQASPIALDPSAGQEIGTVFEAWLSPHQEGGEEEDTPDIILKWTRLSRQ